MMRLKKEIGQLTILNGVKKTEQPECHHQYMNAGTLQGNAMKKCLKCGEYINNGKV